MRQSAGLLLRLYLIHGYHHRIYDITRTRIYHGMSVVHVPSSYSNQTHTSEGRWIIYIIMASDVPASVDVASSGKKRPDRDVLVFH